MKNSNSSELLWAAALACPKRSAQMSTLETPPRGCGLGSALAVVEPLENPGVALDSAVGGRRSAGHHKYHEPFVGRYVGARRL